MKKINKLILLIILILLINKFVFAQYKFIKTLDIAKIDIDINPPIIEIQYVGNDSNGIKVILVSNEEIKSIEGWNLINNYTLEKDFWENVDYNINVEDLKGNQSSINIVINNF